jgi:iron complex outermembrane recepter protein
MKNISMLILSMVCSLMSMGQTSQLDIYLEDELERTPVKGAYVTINNDKEVKSDEDGKFTLTCKDSLKLKITCEGYNSITRTLYCPDYKNGLVLLMKSKTQELKTVIITASSNPYKSQFDQPISIVNMDESALKRSTGLFLDDAINTFVPGATMQRRTQSGGQQINIRGYGNGMGIRGVNSNFDGQGVKMYLNGIPITDAEGITVMDDIDYASVSNTEILKGPSGNLYGMAIAGVVNMTTERNVPLGTSVSQNFMMGSYGLLRSTTSVRLGAENHSIIVNYGHQEFDGFMVHTQSKKDFVNVIGTFNINRKQTISTYLGYANSYDERNGELTIAQYKNLDYSGNARYIKNNAHSAIRTLRAGINHFYQIGRNTKLNTSIFGSSQNMDNSSAGGWTDKSPLNFGFRSTLDTRWTLSKKLYLTGITGIEAQKMNALTVGYGMGADSTNLSGYNIINSIRSNQATTSSTVSYFTQWSLNMPKDLILTAGIGVSNMHLVLDDRLWGLNNNFTGNQKLKTYEKSYNNLIAPTVALNKKISNLASVYVSYSSAYKAPVSSNILISTTGQLNTNLKPEKGTQIELGTKGSLLKNKLFYTVALFNTKFNDKFTTITVQNPDNTATLYSYIVNGGNLNNQGLEVSANYKAIDSEVKQLKSLNFFANMTYSNFKYENYQFERVGKNYLNKDSAIVEDYSGKAVAGVAPMVFNLGVDAMAKNGLYGNLTFNYRGEMPFTSDGLNVADPYQLLNAKIGFKRNIKALSFDLFFGANNITGTQYYNMIFVNQLPDAYIPAPNEINFFGGINLKYNL